ncbi:MAG TPA: HAMP domain-containing histidine kinase, partial [Helicobacteraceae bacterium]|nr:HAMP domain-containing histidine kinase [Helicobacteraceae bacterium]
FTLLLAVGLSAGSIATLSPVYRAFSFFIIPMLSIQIIVSFYFLDQIHLFMAFIVFIFMFVVLSSAHSVYERMKEAIELRDQVTTSEEALLKLNATLEERIEEESKKNAEKTRLLYHQSRHAQMGEMLGMIAHQWRQPLTSISASTTAIEVDMLMDNWDKSLFKEHINRIAMLSQHLSSTIDDFRSFFKENKVYEAVSVGVIIESSLQIIEASMKSKSITIHREESSSSEVPIIRNEMRQVLLNLLKNAEDALLEVGVKEPAVWIKSFEDDEAVYISVEDNAGGIRPEVIEKVFEPYFTTKVSLNGTGLGLYMSKMIIQDHLGAEISVVNSSRGALFTIRIPQGSDSDKNSSS